MLPVHLKISGVRQGFYAAAAAMTLALVALPATPRAQDAPATQPDFANDVPAHIAVVDGKASLERDGQVSPAEENVPLLAGDRLKTDEGRVEILFADGSVLDVDRFAAIDLLSESLLRLRAGRIRLSIVRVTEDLEYRVDAAGVSATIRTAGEYRLGLSDPRAVEPTLELDVVHGTAELSSPAGRTRVRAGTRAFASEHTEPSLPVAFNISAETAFDRWADDQRDARLGVVSTRYLPSELRYYAGTFDDSGDWQYESSYGYVWYPHVATTWSPYYDGRWSVVGSFGWFWIGGGSWCWPTHHYGRWGVASNRWFWIPGRQWGPGWVSWGVSPGYVGWCPLGFDGHPAVGFGAAGRFGHGWTVVPSRTFSGHSVVVRNAVSTPIHSTALASFSRSSAPLASGARSRSAPLRSPSTARSRATPRNADVTRSTEPSRVATPRAGATYQPPVRDSRAEIPPTPSSPPDARRAYRTASPTIPDVPDQPRSPRSPSDPNRPARSYGTAQSRSSAPDAPTSSSSSSSSRSATRPPPDAYTPPANTDSGWRRVAPPSSGSNRTEAPRQSEPPPPSRAVPRGTPPSAPSAPPPSASAPPSRGRESSPPPSSSGSSSGSGSGDRSGAARRTGRGGGR